MRALLLRAATLSLSLALGLGAAQAASDTRVALVIGNAAYAGAPLLNPVNDARAVGDALQAMGFTVIAVRDASKAQMEAAIARAGALLKGRDGVGLLYYAGHGLQLDWRNYLVPVDANVASAADVRAQTVDVQAAIDAFRLAGNRVSIVVLDACRDNPFADGASGKGLAQMDAPPGTLLAFATAPGQVAEDGDARGGNGLYTQHLVRELRQPGTKVEDVFKRVRLQVRRQSAGRQVPWESTSLEDDFYFDASVRVLTLSDAEQARAAAAALARERADWARIRESVRPEDFAAYMAAYPNGSFADAAQSRAAELAALHERAARGPDGAFVLPDPANRFAIGDVLEYERIDGYSKLVTRVLRRVTYADNQRVEFNGGQVVTTQQGGVLRDAWASYTPARLDAPPELAVGKQWRSAYTIRFPDGLESPEHYDYQVVALEDITVPAGTFKAYKVERVGASRARYSYMSLTGTAWIDTATMLIVRDDVRMRGSGSAWSSEWGSFRLVAATRAPRRAGP